MTQGVTEPYITPAWPLVAPISSAHATEIRFVLPPRASSPAQRAFDGLPVTLPNESAPADVTFTQRGMPVVSRPGRLIGLPGRPRTQADPYARSRHNVLGGRLCIPAAPDGSFTATDYTVTLALAVSGAGTPPDVELLLDDVVLATLTPSASGSSWAYSSTDDYDLSAGGVLSLRFASSTTGRRCSGELALTPA